MIYFVGAGPGATDLITVRGAELLKIADSVIYAGSLVNPELLDFVKKDCRIYDSSRMTLEEIINVMESFHFNGGDVVRLHTGDMSVYGTLNEQAAVLTKKGIPFRCVPGVSSFCAAASALGVEYTVPRKSQTVILTRMGGRTPVPENENIELLASHGAPMVFFLSAGMIRVLAAKLTAAGVSSDTPAAVVYKASWPTEKKIISTVGEIADVAEKAGIDKTALVLVGEFLTGAPDRSSLYDPDFSHEFRSAAGKI